MQFITFKEQIELKTLNAYSSQIAKEETVHNHVTDRCRSENPILDPPELRRRTHHIHENSESFAQRDSVISCLRMTQEFKAVHFSTKVPKQMSLLWTVRR